MKYLISSIVMFTSSLSINASANELIFNRKQQNNIGLQRWEKFNI